MAWPTSNFPTGLDTITDKVDSTDDVVAADINGAYDCIEKLEAKVGINGSGVTTSLDYLLKSTSSSNPGHKHTLANGATDITASAAEVNLIDGSVAGTAVASKALVLGANKNVDTLVVADSGLKLGSGAGTAITATAENINNVCVPGDKGDITTSASGATWTVDFGLVEGMIKVSEVQTQGTGGGDTVAATWTKIDINTEDTDSGSHCSLASGVITLAAGTYFANIIVPVYFYTNNTVWRSAKARLRNTSDSTDTLVGNHIVHRFREMLGDNALAFTTSLTITGYFTIATGKNFEIQIYTNASQTNGMGYPIDITGYNEVYTQATFIKIR
jgi:hypothetical protein